MGKTMNELLQRGIALARAGQREEARAALMQVVEENEQSELGWLWLSGVIDDPSDIRVCLENVLELNPENQQARQGLSWIDAHYGAPEPQPEPQPAPQPAAPAPLPMLLNPVQAPEPAPVVQPEEPEREAENPCPYCGSPTTLSDRTCLNCRRSLMVRTSANTSRSIFTTILAGLRFLEAGLTALSGCIVIGAAVAAYQAIQRAPQPGGGLGSQSPLTIATVGVLVFVFAGFLFSVGRGLLRQARWAYITTIVLAAFSLIGFILQLIGSQLALATITATARAQAATLPISSIQAAFNGVILVAVVLQVLYLGLIAGGFRDFFGPMLRFAPSFKQQDHATNYNNGVAYKNRGMWYMAMREWELASGRAPFDLNYLHALGLAYAQVGRFRKARETLAKGLEIAPTNAQLNESRTLVEKMASAKR
jgi:tetratricopeptide (TPR) repeat protein